jgi:hypothetical protein
MKPALVPSKFTRPDREKYTRCYCEEVEMALSAIDCALNRERAIYCSTELTSGRRLYEALRKNKCQNKTELKAKMGEEWIKENIERVNFENARKFAEYVRNTIGDNATVITPAPLHVPGWEQPEYNDFWRSLLRSRIKFAWFNSNWQFSNGCTFEFGIAQEVGLRTLDRNGNRLERSAGIKLMRRAIQTLNDQGFDASELCKNLERLPTVFPVMLPVPRKAPVPTKAPRNTANGGFPSN